MDDFKHSDYGVIFDEEVKKIFNSWNGITILCPDLPKGFKPTLYGDTGSMRSQFWKFQIA